ncbi:uncharacterized protein LOC132726754 isoform X1 [Ruditapes philippinarum]|uniref:uncharacterized protein LOC132726754 isoform X1 n=2 Tax=Ruditapes philippinarum TaxID=129788 RepID=UPI00295A8D26|nr:uncharacterized protein LOC132726754 isoform X1 [Ruditapes philippinarum]
MTNEKKERAALMAQRHNTKRLSALISLLLLLQECHPIMMHSDNAYNLDGGNKDKNKFKSKKRSDNKHDSTDDTAKQYQRRLVDSTDDTAKQHERQLVDNRDNLNISDRHNSKRSTVQLKEVGDANVISFEEVNRRLQLLVTKFRAHEKVVDKVRSGFKNCSALDVESMETVGNLNNPKGILVRLMFSAVLSLANCQLTSRQILHEICNAVDNNVVVEVIETLAELTDDLGQSNNKTRTDASEEETFDNDIEVEQKESSFLANMLAENIMNTNEMMNLFDQLSGGGKFENVSEVNELLSNIDVFNLEEITDNPDFKWIRPISEISNGSLSFKNQSHKLLSMLNANSTRRHLRKIDMKIDVSKSAKLLVIFERKTGKILTSSLNEQLSLELFNITNLEEQLWIIDKGMLINVGSHLSVSCQTTVNKTCLLGPIESKGTDIWEMTFDRIKNGNCFLDTDNLDVHLSCDMNSYETKLAFNRFSSTTEPEKLTQENDTPFLNGPLVQLLGNRLILFMYILGGMVRNLFGLSSEADHIPSETHASTQTEYFFIKNSLHPCKILGMDYKNINHKIYFGEFSEEHIEHYLWYWNENQIINLATSEALQSYNDYGGFTRLWTFDNGTLKSFSNPHCNILETLHTTCNMASDTVSVKPIWTLVSFDQPDFDNFQDVVCMYFIQSEDWPCEYLSEHLATQSHLLSPIGENIFLHLWYKSNEKLVNVGTGNMLVVPSKNDSFSDESAWVIQNNIIFSKIYLGDVLTIDVRNSGRIKIDSYRQSAIQKWKFTQIEDAIRDDSMLDCSDDKMRKMNRYVIRNNEIPGCLILTAVESNDRNFVLDMRPYDENLLDYQTWILHREHIINLGTGFTIAPYGDSFNQTEDDSFLHLDTLYSYKQSQMWTINFEQGTIYSDSNNGYYMDIEKWPYGVDREISYNFITRKAKTPNTWTFTEISSYEVDEEKSLDLLCFYLLRSIHEPCEFVTADLSKGTLYLRPVSQELLENQIWYWSDHSIILAHTGQSIQETHAKSVVLSNSKEQKQWDYANKGLKCKNCHGGKFFSANLHNDGIIYLTYERNKTMDLSFVYYEKLLSENFESCSISPTSGTQLFFIRSHWNKCKVLTGAQYGQRPTFEHLNQDDIESQLWYKKHNHFINLKTNRVLQVVGNEVIMGNYNKYASSQAFKTEGNFIFHHNTNCVLDVNTLTSKVIIWCKIHRQNNQRWDTIIFDDSGNYVNTLTCLFFIRHELTPCELLTDLGPGHTVRLRPPSDSFFNRQLWYWNGDNIINADTGLALEGSYYNIMLRQKSHGSSSQQWTLEGKHLKMRHYQFNRVVGLYGDDIQMVSQQNYWQSKDQHWRFIDAEEGTRNSKLLTCENELRNINIYFLKSEEENNGKCPVLTETRYGDVTMAKASDDYYNQLWARHRKHLLSPESGKALAVNGKRVEMQSKFEHEHFQHWDISGSAIRSTVNGHTKLLDTYNDVIVYSYDGTDGQKWTLIRYQDVEKDVKLLRCKKMLQ